MEKIRKKSQTKWGIMWGGGGEGVLLYQGGEGWLLKVKAPG